MRASSIAIVAFLAGCGAHAFITALLARKMGRVNRGQQENAAVLFLLAAFIAALLSGCSEPPLKRPPKKASASRCTEGRP